MRVITLLQPTPPHSRPENAKKKCVAQQELCGPCKEDVHSGARDVWIKQEMCSRPRHMKFIAPPHSSHPKKCCRFSPRWQKHLHLAEPTTWCDFGLTELQALQRQALGSSLGVVTPRPTWIREMFFGNDEKVYGNFGNGHLKKW